MTLTTKINEEIKTAMKARQQDRLTALRAVKSAILLAKTEKSGVDELSTEDEIKLLQKLVKQRNDSAEIYKSQGRDDLYEQEAGEAKVIEEFLPKQMSAEELETELKVIIEETGAGSMKDMGKVMGIASKKLAGKASGKDISSKVKQLLA